MTHVSDALAELIWISLNRVQKDCRNGIKYLKRGLTVTLTPELCSKRGLCMKDKTLIRDEKISQGMLQSLSEDFGVWYGSSLVLTVCNM